MPVTSITQDVEALTMTVVADFAAPVQRLWDAYLDPRLLERFWGPPTYPASFTRHDGYPGGHSDYSMTGPAGDTARGYWRWLAVEQHRSFEVLDGFADANGAPDSGLPTTRMVFTFEATGSGSRVSTTTYFDSADQRDQVIAMGMEEGLKQAMGQIDAVLADLASFAAGNSTETQVLNDTQVRISRVIRGDVTTVWRAHYEPDLVRQWLLGPDGWTMPVCEIATEVGQSYHYEWAEVDGGRRFGFTGELLESEPPHRAVTTETMTGTDGPSTVNELTLTPLHGGTLLSLLITYPSTEVRDAHLATGMTDGMEASYQRLESLLGLGASAR